MVESINTKPKTSRASVHFDEQEIEEYNKHRGQHQKIDDPKTPFQEFDDQIYAELDQQEDQEMTEENAILHKELTEEEKEV